MWNFLNIYKSHLYKHVEAENISKKKSAQNSVVDQKGWKRYFCSLTFTYKLLFQGFSLIKSLVNFASLAYRRMNIFLQ